MEQKEREWIFEDIRDVSVKDKKGKHTDTKNAIDRYNDKKDKWDPLTKFLFSRRYSGIFKSEDIEWCPKSIEAYRNYKIFRGVLDENLIYSDVRLTADVMNSAFYLVNEFTGAWDRMIEECEKENWKKSYWLEKYLPKGTYSPETYLEFYVFLRLIYTMGNLTPIGAQKRPGSGATTDQWDYLMSLSKEDPVYKNVFAGLYASGIQNPIDALYFQDYIGLGRITDRQNTEDVNTYWQRVFSTYTKLIVRRAYRILNDFTGDFEKENNRNHVVDELIRQLKEEIKMDMEKEATHMTRLTSTQIDDLAYDIIRWCIGWGMWKDTAVYCNGRRYSSFGPDGSVPAGFRGLKDVFITENERPEDHILEGGEGKLKDRFVNPDHILSMTFEGPLYKLLHGEGAEFEFSKLSDQNREAVLKLDTSLEEYLYDWEDSDCKPILDITEFDSIGEFQELEDELENKAYWRGISRLMWERLHYDTTDDVYQYIFDQFNSLFEQYGVWFEIGHSWSLTCFYSE